MEQLNVVLLPLEDEEAAPEAALESSHHLRFKSKNKSEIFYSSRIYKHSDRVQMKDKSFRV